MQQTQDFNPEEVGAKVYNIGRFLTWEYNARNLHSAASEHEYMGVRGSSLNIDQIEIEPGWHLLDPAGDVWVRGYTSAGNYDRIFRVDNHHKLFFTQARAEEALREHLKYWEGAAAQNLRWVQHLSQTYGLNPRFYLTDLSDKNT